VVRQQQLTIDTRGRGTYALTPAVAEVVSRHTLTVGLCNVFVRHTSASLLLTENADPDVRHDLESFMQRLVTDGAPYYRHTTEGADDMAAHVRNMLAGASLVIPVTAGRLALGTWQGIYLWEHRVAPQRREIVVTVSGA
jgi:secondary thiamine-phosphate synthase enzyme